MQSFTTPWGGLMHLRGVFIDHAGRRYVYGARQDGGGSTSTLRGAVVRVRDDGSPDPTFGDGGTVSLPHAAGESYVTFAMAEDVRGRLVLCGMVIRPAPGTPTGSHYLGWVARLEAGGALDNSFGIEGVAVIDGGPGGVDGPMAFYDVALDGERILVVGADNDQYQPSALGLAVGLRADGSFDPDFNGGVPYFDLAAAYYAAVRVTPDGYVAAGTSRVGYAPRVTRLTRGGHPDERFGTHGASDHPAVSNAGIRGLAITAEGITLAGGADAEKHVVMVRFGANGVPVAGFGVGGVATVPSRTWDIGFAFTTVFIAQCDGRLVLLCQDVPGGAHVLRWMPDGTVDTSFAGRDVALRGDGAPVGIVQTANGSLVALTGRTSIASQMSWWQLGE